MGDWREAVWAAVPEGAQPERFAARRAFLLDRVAPGARVLDLGCGDGAFAAALLGAGCTVTMADVAAEALRRARVRAPEAEAVKLVEGEPLPFAEDGFGVVWAGEVLEHVADVVGLLAEVRRVLRWGGRLLVTTPWHGRIVVATDAHFDPRADHLRFFSARTLRAVLGDAGFSEIEVRRAGRGLHAVAAQHRYLRNHTADLDQRQPPGTSIFVAVEQQRPLARALPDQVGVSVITLAELELGVLAARDGDARAIRLATLTRVREQAAGLPIDDRVSSAYARLAAGELSNGRKPRVNDTWIAATALVHGAAVWTQDADFTAFRNVEIVRV